MYGFIPLISSMKGVKKLLFSPMRICTKEKKTKSAKEKVWERLLYNLGTTTLANGNETWSLIFDVYSSVMFILFFFRGMESVKRSWDILSSKFKKSTCVNGALIFLSTHFLGSLLFPIVFCSLRIVVGWDEWSLEMTWSMKASGKWGFKMVSEFFRGLMGPRSGRFIALRSNSSI